MYTMKLNFIALSVVLLLGCFKTALAVDTAAGVNDKFDTRAMQSQPAATLKSSVIAAIGHSPQLAEIQSILHVDTAKIDERKGAWMPQVFVNGTTRDLASNNSSDTESYGISVSQLLYDFGKTTNTIKQAQATVAGDSFKVQSSLNEIADNVATLYTRAERYEALANIAKDNIGQLQHVEKLAQLRAAAGLSTSSDVLQAQTRVIAMQTTLEDYRYQHALAMKQLSVLTGVSASDIASIPQGFNDSLQPFSPNDYDNLPDVQAALTDKQSAQYEVSKAKAGHLPTISLRAERSYSENNGSPDATWDNHLSVNVSVPLYQGGIVSSQIEQAQGNVLSADARIEKAKMDADQRISSYLEDWKGALARKTNSEAQLKSALTTRDVYRNEYSLSTRSLNDLLSVEQDVFQAQQARAMATYDVLQASLSYAASTNTLLKKLNVMP